MKNYIKFSIENKGIGYDDLDRIYKYIYEFKLFYIDKNLRDFLINECNIWHIDFINKTIYPKYDGSICFVDNKQLSIFISNVPFSFNQNYVQYIGKESSGRNKNLFRISESAHKSKIKTDVKDLDQIFIKAMYILVENYKNKILKLNPSETI